MTEHEKEVGSALAAGGMLGLFLGMGFMAIAQYHGWLDYKAPATPSPAPTVHQWTDPKTGCEYLVLPQAITPRMHNDGWHICPEADKALLLPEATNGPAKSFADAPQSLTF